MKHLRLLSFNIRIDAPVDGINQWIHRKEDVKTFLLSKDSDIMGIQEAGPHMLTYLKEHLSVYEGFGVARDAHGESTPVFVKKNRFEVLESKTIWLTDTPDIPSNIIGSNHPRIATYVVLKDQDHMIAFFNTHLDYTGDETTLKQSKFLHKAIEQIKNRYQAKIIISGDFNSLPDSKTIKYLSSCYQMPSHLDNKNQLTFHGFSNQKEGKPIDYFFVDQTFKVSQFQIVYPTHQKYLSDHYPIEIELTY